MSSTSALCAKKISAHLSLFQRADETLALPQFILAIHEETSETSSGRSDRVDTFEVHKLSFQRRFREQRGLPTRNAAVSVSSTVDHATHPNLATANLPEQMDSAKLVTEQAGESIDHECRRRRRSLKRRRRWEERNVKQTQSVKLEERGQQVGESGRLVNVRIRFGSQRVRREWQRSSWNVDNDFFNSTTDKGKLGRFVVDSRDRFEVPAPDADSLQRDVGRVAFCDTRGPLFEA